MSKRKERSGAGFFTPAKKTKTTTRKIPRKAVAKKGSIFSPKEQYGMEWSVNTSGCLAFYVEGAKGKVEHVLGKVAHVSGSAKAPSGFAKGKPVVEMKVGNHKYVCNPSAFYKNSNTMEDLKLVSMDVAHFPHMQISGKYPSVFDIFSEKQKPQIQPFLNRFFFTKKIHQIDIQFCTKKYIFLSFQKGLNLRLLNFQKKP